MKTERAIRALEAAYDDAWNRADIDALIVDPRGGVTRGRDDIRRLLSQVVGSGGAASTHVSEIVRVEFVTPDVALVDGRAHIEGLPEDQAGKGLVHRFTDVIVWRDQRWQIAHIRACPLEPVAPG